MDFDKNNVFVGLNAKDADDLFHQMGGQLEQNGYVKSSFSAALSTRESSFPTGLPGRGWGVGLPHTTPEHVLKPGIAVATLASPVTFKMMGGGGEEVQASLILMLMLKDHDAQIDWLKRLMALIQDEEQMKAIMACETADALYHVINPILQGV